MKPNLPASLALALLSLLPACSTPGTKPAKKSGTSFGKQVGSAASSLFNGLLEIPYAILSIPADIVNDPAAMGAIAQVVSTSQDSSSASGSSGHSSSGSSEYDSGYTYQNTSTRPSSNSDRGGHNSRSDDEDDGLLTPREAVIAFEKAEMQKVEDFKRAMLGGASSPGTGAGGRMIAPSGERQVSSHSRRVPAISEGNWAHVGDFDGVRVWWRYRRELKDQVESALKMENLNSYKVTIEYTAWFLAADGTDYQDSGRDSMAPGAVKSGNTAGLWYHVRDAKRECADPPLSGGIRDMTVTPAD